MGKKVFRNFGEFREFLKKKVDKVLREDVAEYVKDELQSSVSETVYGAGDPEQYVRRGYGEGSGGLADKETMTAVVKNGTLVVTPDAERNYAHSLWSGRGYDTDRSLAFNIEYGYLPNFWYGKPRPFVENARENMRQDKSYVDVMRDGLEDMGIKAKKM